MTTATMTHDIVIVTSIVVPHDAISNSVRDTYNILMRNPNWRVTVFAGHSGNVDIPICIVDDVSQLLLDKRFLAADLIIYHFGIYYPLLDAILVGNGKARQVVRFHNITPKALLSESQRSAIEHSFRQLQNLRQADLIWADSQFNRQTLIDHAFDPECIEVLPLIVEQPPLTWLAEKVAETQKIIFVSRLVPSKGLIEAIEVVHAISDEFPDVTLTVVGNADLSDSNYYRICVQRAEALGLRERVVFVPNASDEVLAEAYRTSHVLLLPTWHEGFCVPVIEALRAGVIPVGYAAGNMPFITNGFGCLVVTGRKGKLTTVLRRLLRELLAARSVPALESFLSLDGGAFSVATFDVSSKVYVKQFGHEAIMLKYLSSVKRLVNPQSENNVTGIRAEFEVVPDDVMRERTRSSLNRLPDPSDWLPGGRLTDLMREMNQPVCIHRKSWEYAICIQGLSDLQVIHPDACGLAVGAGSEAPLYWFANNVRRMVATDLYDNPAHEGTPAMLSNPKAFAPFPYREDRLEVYQMGGDKLDFPDNTFDFVFCLSSIEHFGSRDIQKQSLDEMQRVLRAGGIACIITELILTDHSDKEYFRLEELTDMFLRHPTFQLVGGAPDLSISASQVRYPVDLAKTSFINKSPHIVLKRDAMLWTSFSMFLEKLSVE